MNSRSRNAITAAVIVLVIAQLLNGILAVSSFEETYTNSLISNFRIISRDLKGEIETGVNFGKPITLFSGMDSIFSKIAAENQNIKELYVTSPDREILYSTNKEVIGDLLGSESFPGFLDNPDSNKLYLSEVILYKGEYFISAPVYYNQKTWVGTVYLQFSDSVISAKVNTIIRDNLAYFSIILLSALIVMVIVQILVGYYHKDTSKGFKLKTKNTISIVIILLFSQLFYAYMNNNYFRESYTQIFNTNVNTLSSTIKNDFEYILDQNLKLNRLKKAEIILEQRLKNNPEIVEIVITDTKETALYRTKLKDGQYLTGSILNSEDKEFLKDIISLKDSEVQVVIPLLKNNSPVGYLTVFSNTVLIQKQLNNILLDALTVIVVAMIFSIELLRIFSILLPTEDERKVKLEDPETENAKKLQIIRITSFLFFFSTLIPLSFLPIFIKEIFEIESLFFMNLSKDTILSLPISSYMVGVAIIIPIVGFLSHKHSIRNLFILSIILFGLGTIYSAFASNMLHLIIARFIAGCGYGAGVINSTNLIIKFTDSSNRTTGFGSWSGGFAAASICAISIGGVLVQRLGYQVGFFLSTACAILLGIFVIAFFRERSEYAAPSLENGGFKSFLIIFKNRTLAANLIFSSIPIQLAYIGLFQYVFPLYMNSMNISQSNIGRILTVYGLISLITPFVSRASDRIKNNKLFIIVGNLITGVFLLGFFLYENIILLIITIVAMGIGSMIVDAVNEAFIISSKEAAQYGETKILSIYATYEKIIGIIVPLAAGILITSVGFSSSIGIIGAFTVAGSILFALIGKNMGSADNTA